MLAEQQRLIQEAISSSIDRESLAVYAGVASPVIHRPTGEALSGDEEDDSFEQFKSRWKEKIQVIYDHQNDIKQVRIAT